MIFDKISEQVNSTISANQYRFIPGRCSVHKLLTFLSIVTESLDRKITTDVVYLDISKAFDSVSHHHLLHKLHIVGITGKIWYWIKSYLLGWYHYVSLDGQSSEYLPVKSGVPQGSILGPLLFLVYVNDIFPFLNYSSLFMFADNSPCLKLIRTLQDSQLLQANLDEIDNWCTTWYMRLKPSKCAFMRFGADVDTPPYTVCQTTIPQCTERRDLGILINSSLSWTSHISSILAKAYKSLYLIRRVVPYNSDINFKRSLYLALVRSHLTHCSSIWWPHLLGDSRRLERIQRRCTKYLVSSGLDYKSRLIVSRLLPLTMWLEVQDLLLLVKLMKDPPDNFHLRDYIVAISSSTRASSKNHLKRSHSHMPRLNYTKFFYFNRVIKLWNSLPNIDLTHSYASIKSQILLMFWNYFLRHFDLNDPCTWCIVCYCPRCSGLPAISLSHSYLQA